MENSTLLTPPALRRFDTKVQYLKYRVLYEVAGLAWAGLLPAGAMDVPKTIIPGKTPTMRCCVYKERAIIGERVKMAMGGDVKNPNVIEVIDIACDECPVGGYEVTPACRGCLAHRCADTCKFGAITNEAHMAHIDKNKCKECGQCAKVCPYNAITNHKRPCEQACKVKAISRSETGEAQIDNDICISCGACAYQCPWGAMMDKSYILDVIDIIKKSRNAKYNVWAVIAPSIASQFSYAKLGQVLHGIYKLGFHSIAEAALGADMVALAESKEFAEKRFLASSCCPSFVDFIEKQFPDAVQYLSHSLSPMAVIAKRIKENDPSAKVIFIGPCTAKKAEFQKDSVKPYIDSVITFEELQALFDSRDIDITTLQEEKLDSSSYYGRIFARSGGLSEAVARGLTEQGLDTITLKPISCNGIEECRTAFLKVNKQMLSANFIAGMACVGGCIGGAGCLTHGDKNKAEVDKYGSEAAYQTLRGAVDML
jgi:[FeFe] hydrogenase (group B1/B3)